jgi:type IV secretory pathway VirB4 component
MGRPILWGELEIGMSRDEVSRALPGVVIRDETLVAGFQLFDCDFDASAIFDDNGLCAVTLSLARACVSQRFGDVRQRLVDAICSKHGKGQARQVHSDTFRKRWRERWVEIDFVAVDDPEFPTISVEYRKLAITDAALKYL